MPRPGVTKAQVFEAADQLTQAGHNPTVVAIRKHFGGGSPNTIGPHLADWKAQHENRGRTPPGVGRNRHAADMGTGLEADSGPVAGGA